VNVDWHGLGEVLGVGLIAGVGLVALFAAGVRALATQPAGERQPAAVATATACFVVCAAAAAYGIFLVLAK
jgi:hypothetical protein